MLTKDMIYVLALVPPVLNIWNSSFLLCAYFIVVPIVDACLTIDLTPPIKPTRLSDVVLWAWVPLICLNLWCHEIRNVCIDTLSMGVLMGQSINVAHELIHRRSSSWDVFIGRFLLCMCWFGHWEDIHLKIHHPFVGTELDCDTARKGESIYTFWKSALVKTFKISISTRPLSYVMYSLVAVGLVYLTVVMRGWTYGIYHLCAGFIGIMLLQTLNYIEHYGLTRKIDERVEDHHSWDAPTTISSVLVFKLTHHSDHHMNSLKHYPELIKRRHAPRLPYSYPVMIVLSLFPSLFMHIMHPLLPAR
jgi:alkane 1-monooxygenase